MTATTEFVVPKSIPITLLIAVALPCLPETERDLLHSKE
jgi:hypothetical protein